MSQAIEICNLHGNERGLCNCALHSIGAGYHILVSSYLSFFGAKEDLHCPNCL